MTLSVNSQEYQILKDYLPPDTVVVKPEELGTDAVVQGLGKNRMYERKDLKDFLASIKDRRLWEQLKTLSDNIENGYEPFIIIEGTGFYSSALGKWVSLKQYLEANPTQKMSFYEALTAFRAFKVGLIITMDKQDTALFLSYENVKLGKPKEHREYPERGGFRRDWNTAKKKEYLMEAFGPKVGRALLIEYKTVKNLINRNEDFDEVSVNNIANVKLESGRRIGEKKAKEIYDVLFN